MMRRLLPAVVRVASRFACGLAFGLVIAIIALLAFESRGVLTAGFLTQPPSGLPIGREGGVGPAILGSLLLGGTACLFGSILGLSVAMRLAFGRPPDFEAAVLRMSVRITAGIPSIVLGLFGAAFLVSRLRMGLSLLAAGIVLGIMIFPFIEVRAEEAFLRERTRLFTPSLALGLGRYATVFRLVVPACLPDLASAAAQAAGFAMGATAPVMFTGAVFYSSAPLGPLSPVTALPLHLYVLVSQGLSFDRAAATALVLVALVLILNAAAFLLSGRTRRR
jgi:phosphate transport system permease protein